MNFKAISVLVVDDDAQVREILVQYLRRMGFEKIIEHKDGKAALKAIRNASIKIDFSVFNCLLGKKN